MYYATARSMHRQNPDGSWDSICMTCLQHAATNVRVRVESELEDLEKAHVCDKALMAQRILDRKTNSLGSHRPAR